MKKKLLELVGTTLGTRFYQLGLSCGNSIIEMVDDLFDNANQKPGINQKNK